MNEVETQEFEAHLSACEEATVALRDAGKLPREGRTYSGSEVNLIRIVRERLQADLIDLDDVFENLNDEDTHKMRLQSLLLSGEQAVKRFNHLDDKR